MFSRFTEKAIQAIMLAQEEAKKLNHNYVGTEHILLGILGEGDNIVIKALKELNVSSDDLKCLIEDQLNYGNIAEENTNIPFTQQAKQVLSNAWDEARKLGHNYVNVEHLFLSLFRDTNGIATKTLEEKGVNQVNFKDALFGCFGNRVETSQKTLSSIPTPNLDLFGRDLTWQAKEGKLDPVIGRDKEINRIIQILSRRSKNNPVLTGDPGVGKTAVVEGLAQRIEQANIPEKLRNKRLITLDLGLLVAGTKYRGEFEDRVKKVMEEIRKAKNIIIFIDELHTIIGTGGSEGSLDAANLFKPALSRGELQCIGATTYDEYRKHIEGDGALERRFQSVKIDEPTKEETLQILLGIRERYENYHDVKIEDEALKEAVNLSIRFIADRHLPDKAVDIIDESAAKIMLKASQLPEDIKKIAKDLESINAEKKIALKNNDKAMISLLEKKEALLKKKIEKQEGEDAETICRVVTVKTIAEVVSMWTGIPVTKISEEESKKLLKMDSTLAKKVVGQEEGIAAISRAVKRAKIGLKDPRRPTGSFLFLGPTGVGKSELAKTLAEIMFGSRDALIRIDMSEYMEKHTVSRLIGAPPGYVGFNEGGQLTEPVRRKPYSIVLFDELEKASPEVINILLQVLEDGIVTDSNGRTVSFRNTIIIMTSNVGAKYIQKSTSIGFTKTEDKDETNYLKMKEKLKSALSDEFKPEFINRIDDIVIFRSLKEKHLRLIIKIMMNELKDRLKENKIKISATDEVLDSIVKKGTNLRLGARPLRRALQEHFEDKLSDVLLEKNLKQNISITATLVGDEIRFRVRSLTDNKKKSKKKQNKKQLIVA